MKKRLVYASLVALMLLGVSGCRLPLIDPPIVGRWLWVEDDYEAEDVQFYIIFNRNNTGDLEYRYNGEFDFERNAFTWSYNRLTRTLILDGEELKVKFNLLRTRATLYDPDYPSDTIELRLASTPILRL